MTVVRRGRPGKALPFAAAMLAVALVLGGAAIAYAQEGDKPADAMTQDQIVQFWSTLENTPVFQDSCQFCHGTLKDDATSPKEIIFSHGRHRGQFDCAACHSQFPHSAKRAEITLRPKMEECFACHGLRHGPVGLIAVDECEKCHRTPKDRLRPGFHVYDWKNKPHVQPALDELQTKCMMCHEGPFCDECHEQEFVRWEPEKPYVFDPGQGCMECHKSETLLRQRAGGQVSFQVTGVDQSAHRTVSCIQCHVDFKYDDTKDPTIRWDVNVGLACQKCHEESKEARLSEAAKKYKMSVHWMGTETTKGVAGGNYESATCASCHGGHDIKPLSSIEASVALHLAAFEVCARCHEDKWASYDDYYHGKAYKEGNLDAPSCWDCHEAHLVLPSSDAKSSVSKQLVNKTCGQEGCHDSDRAGEKFGEQAGDLIHTRAGTLAANPIVRFFKDLWPG